MANIKPEVRQVAKCDKWSKKYKEASDKVSEKMTELAALRRKKKYWCGGSWSGGHPYGFRGRGHKTSYKGHIRNPPSATPKFGKAAYKGKITAQERIINVS